jgi:hypothetical protein
VEQAAGLGDIPRQVGFITTTAGAHDDDIECGHVDVCGTDKEGNRVGECGVEVEGVLNRLGTVMVSFRRGQCFPVLHSRGSAKARPTRRLF